MFNLWLSKTDDFLCSNVRNIFETLEDSYKNKDQKINLIHELRHLEIDPLVSVKSEASEFEKDVKLKLRVIIGIFFVLIPLISFIVLSHLIEIQYSYAFVSTFAVAVFASSRMDKIASKYSTFRMSLI